MAVCKSCGNPLPEDAKFCPVCGTPSSAEEAAPAVPVLTVSPAAQTQQSAQPSSAGWYETASAEQPVYEAAPVAVNAKPSIGKITDFYRQAFEILKTRPIRLWGISLLYAVIACLIASLGSLVPLISLPIVLVLELGFYGVILDGLHGKDVRSEQLFQGFRKEELLRNAGGMCWMELWTLIWAFVPVMNIIKAYSYCLTPFILLTDKEIAPTEALRKAMRMSDGYKGKMFGADILLIACLWLVMLVLMLLARIPYVGWIFGIALALVYLAFILFFPLFVSLVHGAIFEAISAVHEE